MKKLTALKLKELGQFLPEDHYVSKDSTKVLGKDLELWNLEGKTPEEIDSEKEYTMNIPCYCNVNHGRRIKRAYKANGREGIKAYIKQYIVPEKHAEFETAFAGFDI